VAIEYFEVSLLIIPDWDKDFLEEGLGLFWVYDGPAGQEGEV
jgi:hypothetical protein